MLREFPSDMFVKHCPFLYSKFPHCNKCSRFVLKRRFKAIFFAFMFNAWFGASFVYIYFVCAKSTQENVQTTFFLFEFSRSPFLSHSYAGCGWEKSFGDNGAEICLKWNIFLLSSLFLHRIKNFCGSIADSVQSKSNIVHIRYFAEATAINSSFSILYTAIREKSNAQGRLSIVFKAFFSFSWAVIVNLWQI